MASRSGSKGMPRDEREAQILDAAAVEFGTRGYAAVLVADVAARAGVSKPLVYQYFSSKDGLFAACAERAGSALSAGIADAMATSDPSFRSAATAVLDAIFTALEPRPHDWNVLYDRSVPRDSDAAVTARRHRATIAEQAATGVGSAFATAELTDPRDLAVLTRVWMNSVSAVVSWWLDNPDQTAAQMSARAHRVLLALTAAQ
ncbi:TetR/AcrR family transcriptional regulator [Nocardia jejuensis]|uniref:TetR/AcrR family transcriptional regulator n=1 Tax=Nocardia jejuensis TaxID=328049 RepID=UPI00082EE58C|nr:TetR/AcrR family transcriptional regulator [Nocardia jejuensis]